MIRIERDPAFWSAIAGHPEVSRRLGGIDPAMVARLASAPGFVPLASTHGGFLFQRRDELGFAFELHTLFTPEGWGREVFTAGTEALILMFGSPCQLITTLELKRNDKSRPPRTFGFEPAGEFSETPFGEARLWVLTRTAWQASPAAQRKAKTCLH
jgi:hypothetical protein